MSSYKEVDSFTADDGTKFVALAGKKGTRIRKIAPDGTETLLASTKKETSRSTNASTVQRQFDPFKKALETAKGGTSLSYTDDDITENEGQDTAGRGILGQKKDVASTVTLSDGTKLSASYGKTGDEVRTVRRLADEVSNYSSLINTGGGDDDDDDTTVLDPTTDTALDTVEDISTTTFDNKTDINNFYDNTVTSGFTAADAQTNMESALTTSVGEAEDDAISNMTKGIKGNVLTTAQGLLSGEDEEDPFRKKRSLIGS
tara:strand:- start:432 stop:1208 length:777 start_codon:yes stop_codon:yes gene_type:complete